MSKRPGDPVQAPLNAPTQLPPANPNYLSQASGSPSASTTKPQAVLPNTGQSTMAAAPPPTTAPSLDTSALGEIAPPPAKKSRTNTPWTPAEEQRLKIMRDAGNSWAEIAKVNS